MADPSWWNAPPLSQTERLSLLPQSSARPSQFVTPNGAKYDPLTHYRYINGVYSTYPLTTKKKCDAHNIDLCKKILKAVTRKPSLRFIAEMSVAIDTLLTEEKIYYFDFPEIDWNAPPPESYLDTVQRTLLNRAEEHLATLNERRLAAEELLFAVFTTILQHHAPEAACINMKEDASLPTLSLIERVAKPHEFVDGVLGWFVKATYGSGEKTFPVLQSKLLHNLIAASGQAHNEITPKTKLLTPLESGLDPLGLVETYFDGTAFQELLKMRVPFAISIEDRLEHTAIIAGSGHGKTQLLQSIIAQDLELDDPPGYIIVDSTGAMVQEIQRLAVFNGRLRDRLLVIDPERDPVPALNMFDISTPRFQNYSPAMKESIESEVIDLFNYVFSSIGNELTAQQATPFAFMVRLMLALPGSNLQTMRELLEDRPRGGYDHALPKFKAAIETLDPATQSFFKTQYYTQGSDSRREQIAQRIYAVIKVPAFERMFSTVNKVDMFAEMNRGAIIVVNSNENFLRDASALFGRYIVARVMAAAFERASIPAKDRRPAFLVVDEAAPYFDDTFEKLLTRVRQFKLGVVIAFQHLEQASGKLRSAIASSTAIKYAGGLGYADTQWLAREMRVDPEFIIEQKRHSARPPQWTKFACYVRNYTDHAISLTIPFFALENAPKMTDAEHAELMRRNAALVSAAPVFSPVREETPAKVSPPSLIDEVMAAIPRSPKKPKSPPNDEDPEFGSTY